MNQFGSSSSSSVVSLRAKKHTKGATKVSLFCILSTLLAISISTLLLFLRFHDAIQQAQSQQQQQPLSSPLQLQQENFFPQPRRKTVQQLEKEEYMRTGRKPKGVDPRYSDRVIPEVDEEDSLLMPKEEKAYSHFAKITRKTHPTTHPPTRAPTKRPTSTVVPITTITAKPIHEKKTHFFQDFTETPPVDTSTNIAVDSTTKTTTISKTTNAKKKTPKNNYSIRNKPPPLPQTITPLVHPTASPPLEPFDNPKIHFLNISQVSMQDSFSASWLQRRQEFMDMPLEKIMICEDAAWEAWKSFPERLTMTLDVLDFSVEHLSKWWKFMTFWKTDIAYDTLMTMFDMYISRGNQYNPTPKTTPILGQALSMIAFQPYLHKHETVKHYNLTVISLAATIESIRRAQMGRVVVVGLVDNGHELAQEAFRHLAQHVPHTANPQGVVTKIGHLEVAYARGSAEWAKSKHLAKNIPRAVLYGTRRALELGDQQQSQQLSAEESAYVQEWLGNEREPSYWKYLYLTEPDTLLNLREIPQLKAMVDRGHVLAPHRLQPIPHESDLKGLANKFRYLNEENGFDHVWELDVEGEHDVCCDEHEGPDKKPGKTDFDDCGTWWYMCGFKKDYNDKSLGDVHERLRPYQFMKLKQGTGLTLLSGNLFGRRCFPAKKSFCQPPPS